MTGEVTALAHISRSFAFVRPCLALEAWRAGMAGDTRFTFQARFVVALVFSWLAAKSRATAVARHARFLELPRLVIALHYKGVTAQALIAFVENRTALLISG